MATLISVPSHPHLFCLVVFKKASSVQKAVFQMKARWWFVLRGNNIFFSISQIFPNLCLDSSYTLNEELDLAVQGYPGLCYQLIKLIRNLTKLKQGFVQGFFSIILQLLMSKLFITWNCCTFSLPVTALWISWNIVLANLTKWNLNASQCFAVSSWIL